MVTRVMARRERVELSERSFVVTLNFTGGVSKFADLLEENEKYVTLVFLELESATVDQLQKALSLAQELGYTRFYRPMPVALTFVGIGRLFLEKP